MPLSYKYIYPLLVLSSISYSEEQTSLIDLSLAQLLNVKITSDIASNSLRPIIEQPSILSVITREQILNSGARDLLDVLRMVPGFGFAHDTAGINSWGFRGIWGHEGKMMLLVDGAPQNDPAWGNLQFGRHYPVKLIKKIEIIRGPGAAKYGNYAELAVVKVTMVDEELNGGFVDLTLRQMESEFGSAELSAAYGKTIDSDLSFSLYLHSKEANRTTSEFSNNDGSITTSQNNSPLESVVVDAKLNYKSLTFKSLFEQYSFEHEESLNLQLPSPDTVLDQKYRRSHLAVDYSEQLTSNFKLNSSILYQDVISHDMTVKSSNEFNLGSHYLIDTERLITTFDGTYLITDNSSLSFGLEYLKVDAHSDAIGEYFVDAAHIIEGDSTELTDTWFNGTDSFSFHQNSAFLQYENYNDVVNFTLGARFADHSESAKSILVPRISLSKTLGQFGVKLMYNEAFRTGDAEHLNLSAVQLKPETLASTELEFHYQQDNHYYSINFFHMLIEDSIVFNTDAVTENKGEMQSDGIEVGWLNKSQHYQQELTLSYYQGGKGSLDSQLAIDNKSYLAFPRFKATWYLNYHLSEQFVIHPSIVYEGKKYWRSNLTEPLEDKKLDANFLVNLSLNYVINGRLNLSASVHDLFNQGYYFPQAYGQVLFPGDSREFSLNLNYSF